MNDELLIPLTEIEKAELSVAAGKGLTEAGRMLLRRLLFQFDVAQQQLTAERAARERLLEEVRDTPWFAYQSAGFRTAADQLAALDKAEGA